MLTKADAKLYLHIDYSDDDNLIDAIITEGYDYLRSAVDDYDDLYEQNTIFARRCDHWVKVHYFPTAYEQREGGTANAGDNLNYVARSILTQLQTFVYEEE